MNREIIFRGKNINGEWVYGYYTEHCSEFPVKLPVIQNDEEDYVVTRETVGQFTGLYDKNGKKIFEGDILLKGFEKVVVKWNSNQCRWGIYSNGYEISGFNESTKNYFEVVGNIHDNLELLENK